jgi:hypothetical protein
MRTVLAILAALTMLAAGAAAPALAHGGAGGGFMPYTPPYHSLCSNSPTPCPDYSQLLQ